MKSNLIWLAVLLAASTLARAETDAALEPPIRYGHSYIDYVVHNDGTAIESREWSMTVLKETGLEWSKRASVNYSTSAQRAEVVAAYTVKSDGRRLDVSKDNYQFEINRGKDKDSPVYSDISTLSVVFPDVAVGDTIVFSYRLVQTEPLFPKHFSTAQTIPPHVAYDDLRVRFEYPASLWVQYDARGMKQTENSEKSGRKVVAWTYSNPRPVKSERRNFSVYDPDKEVGIAFSTFRTYADIAAAYGARARPKAVVTERIKTLAAEIVKDTSAPKEQARLLYEWVARNITYAGNCVGIGVVVPRDLPYVLDNKMGDCKDHATLLQALFAARGIQSTQALVNAGSVYRLPKVPVVSTVNHVINYIPAFNLFVDSTSDSTPFGMLPFDDQDKPVLLAEGYKAGFKTPPSGIGANQQRTTSVLKIAQDGSVSGFVEVSQKGENAVQTRAWVRTMPKEYESDMVKNMFMQQDMVASGKFEKDDPTALVDTYRYKADFTVEKFVNYPGSGAFYIYPLLRSAGSINNFFNYSMEPEKDADVTCSSGILNEEYQIELPRTMKVLSIPDDLSITNDLLTYHSTYQLDGNVLSVRREVEDRAAGNVCSPQVMAQYREIGDKIMDDLKSQVLYKWKAN